MAGGPGPGDGAQEEAPQEGDEVRKKPESWSIKIILFEKKKAFFDFGIFFLNVFLPLPLHASSYVSKPLKNPLDSVAAVDFTYTARSKEKKSFVFFKKNK